MLNGGRRTSLVTVSQNLWGPGVEGLRLEVDLLGVLPTTVALLNCSRGICTYTKYSGLVSGRGSFLEFPTGGKRTRGPRSRVRRTLRGRNKQTGSPHGVNYFVEDGRSYISQRL